MTISPFSAAPASSITAPNNTPAGRARAAGLPEPVRTVPQQEWRTRRRQRLITQHLDGGGFSPSREVAEVAGPLAQRIAALAARQGRETNGPTVSMQFKSPVGAFADAVSECVSALIGWQAEHDGHAKTQHLEDDPGKRRHALNLLKDTAKRPELPTISAVMISRGLWAAALAEMAAAAEGLRVAAGYSDRLERLLRETVDQAAGDLERKIAWAESSPPVRSAPAASTSTDQARAELARMGIET